VLRKKGIVCPLMAGDIFFTTLQSKNLNAIFVIAICLGPMLLTLQIFDDFYQFSAKKLDFFFKKCVQIDVNHFYNCVPISVNHFYNYICANW
jgi:hypothetical protein